MFQKHHVLLSPVCDGTGTTGLQSKEEKTNKLGLAQNINDSHDTVNSKPQPSWIF